MEFSDWLSSQMSSRGMSQSDLARAAKVSNTAISNVLTGTRSAGPEFCTAIANAFGYPPEVVFRAAGLLPHKPELDEETEQIMHLFEMLEPDNKEIIIKMAEAFIEQRKTKGG